MKTAIEYFQDGRQAALQGLQTNACPLRFKAWPYECWQLGWQLGDIEEQIHNGYYEPETLPDNPKTPFQQGRVGFAKGLSAIDGPYEPSSADAVQWLAGWRRGFAETATGLTQANTAPRAKVRNIAINVGIFAAGMIVGLSAIFVGLMLR